MYIFEQKERDNVGIYREERKYKMYYSIENDFINYNFYRIRELWQKYTVI